MRKNKTKKILSAALSLAMCFSLVTPTAVNAAQVTDDDYAMAYDDETVSDDGYSDDVIYEEYDASSDDYYESYDDSVYTEQEAEETYDEGAYETSDASSSDADFYGDDDQAQTEASELVSDISRKDIRNTDTDVLTEKYILENADEAYVSVKNMKNIHIVNGIYVKQTLFDGSIIRSGESLDGILYDIEAGNQDQADKLLTQMGSVVAVYDVDEDSDYYVAFVNTLQTSESTTAKEAYFAQFNDYANMLDGCVYDYDTGIAYIPKTAFGDELIGLQVQLMQLVDDYLSAETDLDTASVEGKTADVLSDTCDLIDTETFTQVETGMDPESISVTVNGIPVDEEYYAYDSQSGIIHLGVSPAMAQTVQVTEENASASVIGASLAGSVFAKAISFADMDWYSLKLDKSLNATKLTDKVITSIKDSDRLIEADRLKKISAGDVYKGEGKIKYIPSKNSLNPVIHDHDQYGIYGYYSEQALVNAIEKTGDISTSKISSQTAANGLFNFLIDLTACDTNSKWDWLDNVPPVLAQCAHISSSLDKGKTMYIDASKSKAYSAYVAVRVFKYVEPKGDGDIGYIVLGVNTQEVDGQVGSTIIKLPVIKIIPPNYIKVRVRKYSTDRTWFKENLSNGDVTMEGAVYGLYSTRAQAEAATPATKPGKKNYKAGDAVFVFNDFDDLGRSEWSDKIDVEHDIDGSAYHIYIRELASPANFQINDKVYHYNLHDKIDEMMASDDISLVKINLNENYPDAAGNVIEDKPESEDGGLKVKKVDEFGDPLPGVTFAVFNNTGGPISPAGESEEYANGAQVCTITSKADGIAKTSKNYLPLGKYTVKEISAPEGYVLSDEERSVDITKADTLFEVDPYEWENHKISGGVSVIKVDKEAYEKDSSDFDQQGDADLSGAKFSVINASGKDIRISKDTVIADGEEVTTITTEYDEENGYYIAKTADNALPIGTYKIKEKTAPEGYLINEDWVSEELTIAEDGQMLQAEVPCENQVIRGGFKLYKYDAETGINIPLGKASFEGIDVELYNKSQTRVLVNGEEFAPGELIDTFTFNDAGIIETADDLLPYGTYELREVKRHYSSVTDANDSYTDRGKTVTTFSIRENKRVFPLNNRNAFSNYVKRGDFEMRKIDDDQHTMAGVLFKIESVTTGETHYFRTDENGEYSSKYSNTATGILKPHSYNTNSGDSERA